MVNIVTQRRKSGIGYRVVSENEFREHLAESESNFATENQEECVQWNPADIAEYTPSPARFRNLLPKGRVQVASGPWLAGDAYERTRRLMGEPILRHRDWFIFGGGASTLKMDLRPLDNQIVYGINWTMKWFYPTFIQIVDRNVYKQEMADDKRWEPAQRVVIPVMHSHALSDFVSTEHAALAASFHMHHPGNLSHAHDLFFAEDPGDRMTHYGNSIGWALNYAHFFAPRRIFLLGFDWGGNHIFGDGRYFGAGGAYGLDAKFSPILPKLEWLVAEMLKRGNKMAQIGDTRLTLFKDRGMHYDTLEEALKEVPKE